MLKKTSKYQKKYGFEVDENPKERTHNNEADAFKHAFMQASLTAKYTAGAANGLAYVHEWQGDRYYGQSGDEKNMDLWNNEIGREIGKEVKNEIFRSHRLYTNDEVDDLIAEKVMQRMRSGDLITHPNDQRKYRTPSEKFSDELKEKWRNMQQKSNSRIQNKTNTSKKSSASGTTDGKWVTINGHHVLIDK